jgi:hypothetical protein
MYWMHGLLPIGNISLGWDFVRGSMRVPNPAAGITAFLINHLTFLKRLTYDYFKTLFKLLFNYEVTF